jgi:cbb3-type cytochrome oxidase subunit 3
MGGVDQQRGVAVLDLWYWIADMSNSKIVALLLFSTTFVGILIYVFTGRKRARRLESYRYIPFQDDEDKVPNREDGNK